jgi:hypothetical protein
MRLAPTASSERITPVIKEVAFACGWALFNSANTRSSPITSEPDVQA